MKRTIVLVVIVALLFIPVSLHSNDAQDLVKIGIIDSYLSTTTLTACSFDETFRLRTNTKLNHGDMIVGVLKRQIAECQLFYACALDESGNGEICNIVSAIDWMHEQSVDIVCMSFTTAKDTPLLYEAIARLINDGVVVVSACLNYSDIKTYPAAYPGVISVANCSSQNAVISITSREIKQTLLGYKWNDCSTSSLSAYISGKIAHEISKGSFDKDRFIKQYASS